MRLSDLSIARPVLATVLNLLVVVAGLVGFAALPVREYPDVDSPVVSVSTFYPGASPETVESTITEPLERVLNGVDGVRTIRSSSTQGASYITIELQPGRDVDVAATDVTSFVQRAVGRLPALADRPVVRKADANSNPILWLNLYGPGWSPPDLTDLADRRIRTPLQTIPGVAQAIIGGERRYAMRVWLDPQKMAARAVDPDDVRRAIQDSNLQVGAGEIEAQSRKFTIRADAILDDPRLYEDLVVRAAHATASPIDAAEASSRTEQPVRLRDIGWVELGAESYQTITRVDGRPIVSVGIIRQSRANELAVSAAVRAALPELRASLPPGVELGVSVDNSVFVEASLGEVWETLIVALGLVIAVNLFFLRSVGATTIVTLAIPVSVVGTFAALWMLGFSINTLTLLSLVLSIGLLVDDAIVVLENVYRRQELGEPPLEAAVRGAREVGFAVIATSASIIAVLVPLSLLPGSTGRLFREFSLTMAVSIAISTFVALTLVPALCSRFLRVQHAHGRAFQAIEAVLSRLESSYARALDSSLRHRAIVGLFVLATLVATAALYRSLPVGFVPTEDRGQFTTVIRAPQGSTSSFTLTAVEQVEAALREIPEIRTFFSAVGLAFGGGPGNSASGIVSVRLHPWDQRKVGQLEVVERLRRRFSEIPQALVFPVNQPSLAQRSSSEVELVVRTQSGSLTDLGRVVDGLVRDLREVPSIVNVDTDLRLENPEIDVVFDRERSADLGIPVRRVADALQILVSQARVDQFVFQNRQYDVIASLAARDRTTPQRLEEIHLRAESGAMVPLSALARLVPGIGPTTANRYDLERSATITANVAPGFALGTALEQSLVRVRASLPADHDVVPAGVSREFLESSSQVLQAFALSLLVVFLVLAAQFESWVHPVTVLVSVPLATLGALLALRLAGETLNLMSQIGLVLLIGLVTKNAILLVDFANQARERGAAPLAAVREAGRTRLRPILMTSATSILGAVPLALASGAGAESRHPIGLATVGGLLFSTVFTLVVVPPVHLVVGRIAERLGLDTRPLTLPS